MSKRPFLWWRKEPTATSLIIGGEKVILREKRLEDASDDYRWRVDEELSRLDDSKPLTIPYSGFLELYREELLHPSPWSRRFGIDTLEGKHIGNCMYYGVDYLRRQTELGIMIGERDYWCQGYGSDATATLIGHIFSTTSMKRVYLHTLEWNMRGRRAFAKAGFHEVRRVNRHSQPFVLMEIWRDGVSDKGSGKTDPGRG